MTRSMTRWALTGCMALAVLGAVAGLDVCTPTAEAAPAVSQFAGTYVGWDPQGRAEGPFTITISDGGRITGVGVIPGDKISGRVGDDGSYSVSVTATVPQFVRGHGPGPSEPEIEWRTIHSKSSGDMTSDGGGNLVVTDDAGWYGSHVWVGQ